MILFSWLQELKVAEKWLEDLNRVIPKQNQDTLSVSYKLLRILQSPKKSVSFKCFKIEKLYFYLYKNHQINPIFSASLGTLDYCFSLGSRLQSSKNTSRLPKQLQ